jgi:hypothetical protein
VAQKKGIVGNQAEEVRNTAAQATSYTDEHGKRAYNKRKIYELPNFLAQLTASISIKYFCELVFFNYDFFSGMLHVLNVTEFYDITTKAGEASTYKLSDDLKEYCKDLQLVKLIVLQIGASMSDYPDSGVAQFVCKSLKFYNFSPNFRRLIDEYYKQSYVDCSLIVPYAFLHSPGGDLLFQLEKHTEPIYAAAIGWDNDKFVFSLSEKLILFCMENLDVLGEVYLVKTNDPFKRLITFFSEDPEENLRLKNMRGGFLAANSNSIVSYSYDSTLRFHKTFECRVVQDLVLISASHVLVQFEKETTLFIYNIYTGENVCTEIFEDRIEKIRGNTHKDYINQCEFFKQDKMLICVLLASMDFTLFEVVQEEAKIKLDKILSLPYSGFDIVSFSFSEAKDVYRFESDQMAMSFNDGSVAIIDIKKCEMGYLKPIVKGKERIQFEILEFLSVYELKTILLLGSNKFVYLIKLEGEAKQKMVEIPGNYDNASILSDSKVACFKKGIIFIYLIDYSDNGYHCVNKNQINAHYNDDITFGYVKDTMFLTASIDSTIKVHVISRNKSDDGFDEFDSSETEIQKICALNERHCVTIGELK